MPMCRQNIFIFKWAGLYQYKTLSLAHYILTTTLFPNFNVKACNWHCLRNRSNRAGTEGHSWVQRPLFCAAPRHTAPTSSSLSAETRAPEPPAPAWRAEVEAEKCCRRAQNPPSPAAALPTRTRPISPCTTSSLWNSIWSQPHAADNSEVSPHKVWVAAAAFAVCDTSPAPRPNDTKLSFCSSFTDSVTTSFGECLLLISSKS